MTRNKWLIAALAVVAVAMIGLVAFAVTHRGAPPETTPSVVTPSVVTPSPSEEPSQSQSAAPQPSVSRTSVKSKSAYCQAYQRILDTSPTTEPTDEEGGADLKRLSATYAALIAKYSAAEKLAPASLKDDYATVLRYLRDFKVTADSGDWNAVRAQLRQLVKLNESMDSIQSQSDKICN